MLIRKWIKMTLAVLWQSGVCCKTMLDKWSWKCTEFLKMSPFRLDYSGIAFLIMGSFVPWLYYSFYCSPQPCVVYSIVVCILGLAAITVSQCDFFATPQYRGVRAGKRLSCIQSSAELLAPYMSLLLSDCLHWASYHNFKQHRMCLL